jgi:hypothetical protein
MAPQGISTAQKFHMPLSAGKIMTSMFLDSEEVIYGSKENTWETVTVIYWMTTLVHIWQI